MKSWDILNPIGDRQSTGHVSFVWEQNMFSVVGNDPRGSAPERRRISRIMKRKRRCMASSLWRQGCKHARGGGTLHLLFLLVVFSSGFKSNPAMGSAHAPLLTRALRLAVLLAGRLFPINNPTVTTRRVWSGAAIPRSRRSSQGRNASRLGTRTC